MASIRHAVVGPIAAVLFCGCFEPEPEAAPRDGGADAGTTGSHEHDGGTHDAGEPDGGNTEVDAGVLDAGVLDAGAFDAGAFDAGAFDAGAFDAGADDAGVGTDAGGVDAGSTDAGTCIPPAAGYEAGRAYPSGIAPTTAWTWVSPQPVLSPSPSGWDSASVNTPSVLKVGGQYWMWYSGSDGAHWRIGRAVSPDGVNWTRDPTPVLDLGALHTWDSDQVQNPNVVLVNGTFYMFYAGAYRYFRIGLATSTDGINFTRSPQNPVVSTGATWDTADALAPSVVYDGCTFTMWYVGDDYNWRIGRATSVDGLQWVKDASDPVLGVGAGGEPNQAFGPTAILIGSGAYMTYASAPTPLGPVWQLGTASSPDGLTWFRQDPFPAVPVQPGTFYGSFLQGPGGIVIEGTRMLHWTSGTGGGGWAIGLLEQNLP